MGHEEIFKFLPEILGLQDRDPSSPTRGCFDRDFWAWKAKDMPNLSRQALVYPLAFLWGKNRSLVTLDPQEIIESVRCGLAFLKHHQRSNGSFDQIYPHENNTATTAYTLLGPLKAYLLMQHDLPSADHMELESIFMRARNFLLSHDENYGKISNHIALCSHVCLLLERALSCEKSRRRAEHFLKKVLSFQHPDEGWFAEYGEPDPAYETQTLWHLAACHSLTQEKTIVQSCQQSIQHFLQYFISPDGRIGGNYTRRAGSLFYPTGFFYFSDIIPLAKAISQHIQKFPVDLTKIDLDNRIRLLLSLTDAQEYKNISLDERQEKLPFERDHLKKEFHEGGFHIESTPWYYSIFSAHRGGSLIIWDKNKKIRHEVHGYALRLPSSQWFTSNGVGFKSQVFSENGKISVVSPFQRVSHPVTTPTKQLLLRILNLTLLRWLPLSEFFKKRLVRVPLKHRPLSKLGFSREVTYESNVIRVKDAIQSGLSTPSMIQSAEHIVPFHSVVSGLNHCESGWKTTYHSVSQRVLGREGFLNQIQISFPYGEKTPSS